MGQPELAAKLDRYELRQLKQRIAVQAVLSPLTRKESREYLRFRLEKAGGRAEDIFTPRALEKIVRRAKGIPRALNILADNALVTGFGYRRKPVTVKVVREIIADLEGRRRTFFSRFVPAASLASLLLLLGVLGVSVYSYHPPVSGSKVSVTLSVSEADQAARPPVKGIEEGKLSRRATPLRTVEREIIEPTNPAAPPKRKEEISPPPEQQPAAAEERPASGFPFTRKVREGENLYRLTLEVYGASNPELWRLVRKHNPWIKEDLKIKVGQKIVFPEWKAMAKNGG